ncbi:iron ABC transporter permease [Paenibacillus sp. VCA1]|uniref:FecCD family ABC transporter permease n=1 Tax=Paenibacillus sp. VCA1 TaxID=3039148 RepID=UPI00287251B3|nr:iron ABC transporter permease [Paenibacillus sp. VCA1]MDR9853588.1 iron ABC transporter permease [Paenibacillus sp. VCA1]
MNKVAGRIPFTYKILTALLLLAAVFILSMVVGAADISVKDVWLALTSKEAGEKLSIIREIRLPREVAAIFVGAALAVAGAIMQGMTRNPLADPGLLGLTAGANAALAVTLAFLASANYYGLMIACFIGAAAGAALVFGISAVKRGGFSPLRIVLAGAAISAFLNAVADGVGITFKKSKDVSMWTSGGLIGANWSQLQTIVPFIVIGIVVALLLSKQLTILSLSEEVAVGLGQKTARIKAILFVVTVLLAGASVALVGSLTFLGLMIPHIVRAIVGTDYRFIIPMSAALGAAFMIIADTLARTISAPYEAPVVAIVAVLGLPFFLVIARKGGRANL